MMVPNRLTIEQISRRLERINPQIKICGGKYVNNRSHLHCLCNNCGQKWKVTWGHLSQGRGCPHCSRERVKWNLAEIVDLMKTIHPQIKILSTAYSGIMSKLQCACMVCGCVWNPTWDTLKRKHGCPRCDIERRSKKSQTPLRLKSIELLHVGHFRKDLVKCLCTKCSHTWTTTGTRLKRGHGCPQCGHKTRGEKNRLQECEIAYRLSLISPTLKLVSGYNNSYTPVQCLCLKCENTFLAPWTDLSRGRNCPRCYGNNLSEEKVREILESLTGKKWPRANPTEVPFLRGLHLDCYCSELKSRKFPNGTAIERQGEQHYGLVNFGGRRNKDTPKKFLKRKRNDWRKKYQCWYHGIRLILIPYWIKNVRLHLENKLGMKGNHAKTKQRSNERNRQDHGKSRENANSNLS